MSGYVRVHLVDGTHIDGTVDHDITDEQFGMFKEVMANTVMGSGGWQVNLEMPNGDWAVFPKQSVLYVQFVKVAA